MSSLTAIIAETFVTLDVVARRVGDGLRSPRHRHVSTSKADSCGTTTRVSSASIAAVVTVLCGVGDCFAGQLRLVLGKIQPSHISIKSLPKFHQRLECCTYH